MQGDLADRRLLVNQRVLRVLGPVIGGADNDPVGKGLATRRSEEAIDVLLLQLVIRVVELALDGVDFTRAGDFGHQVDAIVLGSEALTRRPLRPSPDLAVQILVGGLVAQLSEDQFLEVRAFLALRHGGVAVGGKKLGEVSHVSGS